MVMVCPLRPRCARPPLPEGEARDAHTVHQKVVGADGAVRPEYDAKTAGRCGHRPLRTSNEGVVVQRLSLRHGEAVTPPSQGEARGVPRLRARRGNVGIAPYEVARGAADNDGRTESSERNT